MSQLTASKLVLDTNVLIDSPEILLDKTVQYLISYITLQELDGLKKDPDLNYAVRNAIKIIYQQMRAGTVQVVDVPDTASTNDEKIVQAARDAQCPLLTQDIGAMAVAMARDVEVYEDDATETQGIEGYTGYVEVAGTLEYENYVSYKEMQLGELEVIFGKTLRPNEYMIIDRVSGNTDIWVEQQGRAVRVAQTMKSYKASRILITPIDAFQHVAWMAVASEVPLTVLEGRVGSSKTLSALVGLLVKTIGPHKEQRFTKIYYTRAPVPVDKSLKLGYAPGTIAEKSQQWTAGVSSNLRFLFGAELGEKVLADHFSFVSLESIQGLSLQPDEALLVDEYQLLSRDMLKQVLSRVGEGGKVVLAGDPAGQTYGANRSREGFKVLQNFFGITEFVNYVQLNNVYRSKFVEFVEEMFDN